MDIYNLMLGFCLIIFPFWYFIIIVTNTKKEIGVFQIKMLGGLIILIMVGASMIYTEIKKLFGY